MAITIPFKEQLRRNAVALISLFVAVSGLSYNTWRNEASEHNRNQRLGAFEILEKVGEFEKVVWNIQYDMRAQGGTPRDAWALARTIQDVAVIMDAPIPQKADALHATWSANHELIGKNSDAVALVREATEELRVAARVRLQTLD